MAETNEAVVEEVAVESEEVVAEETVVEETAETKKFSEMTEDEQLALSDDELIKGLEEAEESVEEEVGKKDAETIPADKTDDSKSLEDKIRDGEELNHDELEKATPEQRGLHYATQKARQDKRDAIAERDQAKAISEAQLKVIEKMREGKAVEESNLSEEDKISKVIADKAKKHEDETGEEYALTARDWMAIETAKKKDYQVHVQNQALTQEKTHVDNVTRSSIETLKTSLGEGNDFDHVYENIIMPLINPNIAKNPQEAVKNARTLIDIARSGGDPASYAYEVLAKQSEEGKKYFESKNQTKKIEKDVKKSTKEITKSTSQLDSTKTTQGKTAVTIQDLHGEGFEKLEKTLSHEQFMKVVGGETVYI